MDTSVSEMFCEKKHKMMSSVQNIGHVDEQWHQHLWYIMTDSSTVYSSSSCQHVVISHSNGLTLSIITKWLSL
jgi:hypothetical protein